MNNDKTINFNIEDTVFKIIDGEGTVNVNQMIKVEECNNTDFMLNKDIPQIEPDFTNTDQPSGIKNKVKSIAEDYGLPIYKYDVTKLDELGKSLAILQGDHSEDPFSFQNSRLPAVLTYWGQFIAHDVDLFKLDGFDKVYTPNELMNGRTPKFDLDSVFKGNALYNADGTLATEINVNGIEDLPRDGRNVAQIGDPRNDENKIIAQIQLTFIKYYNKVLNELKLKKPDWPLIKLMNRAKQLTRFAYQWITANEYLKLLCGPNYNNLFDQNGKPKMDIIKPDGKLPIEFSFAAFRLHVLVRELYYSHDGSPEMPILDSDFTAPSFMGFSPLTADTVIDWSHFLPMRNCKGFQTTNAIAANVAFPLTTLFPPIVPTPPWDIEARTLRRSNQVPMSNGQEYAKLFGFTPITSWEGKLMNPAFLDNGKFTLEQQQELINYFETNTPLWAYIVKEAEIQQRGQHLGELGSAIVAQSIFGMLYSQPNTFVNKGWKPKKGNYGCTTDGEMTFMDFFTYANDIAIPDNVWFTPTLDDNLFKPQQNSYLNEQDWLNDFAILNFKILNTFTEADAGKRLTINLNFGSIMIETAILIRTAEDLITTQSFKFPGGLSQIVIEWTGTEYIEVSRS